jgi:hypothetical protein
MSMTPAFGRDRLELLLGDRDVSAPCDLVSHDEIVVADRLAGLRIHPDVANAMAGAPVDLVQPGPLCLGRGRIERDRHCTSDRRKKPFQEARGAIGNSWRSGRLIAVTAAKCGMP